MKKEKHIHVGAVFPEHLVGRLDREAAKEGRSRSGQLRFIVSEALDERSIVLPGSRKHPGCWEDGKGGENG